MPRKPRRRFPNIEAVEDPSDGCSPRLEGHRLGSGRAKRGPTREDQQQAFKDAQELVRMRERIDDDDPNPTLKMAMGRVESMLDVKGRRPATKEWYLEKFEQLKDEFGEDTLLRDVTRHNLQVWINRR